MSFLEKTTRVLVVCSLGLAVWVVWIFLTKSNPNVRLAADASSGAESPMAGRPRQRAGTGQFEQYASVFQSRDIFMSPYEKEIIIPAEDKPTPVPPEPEIDLSQNFRLVGIVIDDKPRVIIEDLEKQETLFLSAGDKLGEASLKEIQPERVIFSYRGQQVELLP